MPSQFHKRGTDFQDTVSCSREPEMVDFPLLLKRTERLVHLMRLPVDLLSVITLGFFKKYKMLYCEAMISGLARVFPFAVVPKPQAVANR